MAEIVYSVDLFDAVGFALFIIVMVVSGFYFLWSDRGNE